jgi:hypothetical protein
MTVTLFSGIDVFGAVRPSDSDWEQMKSIAQVSGQVWLLQLNDMRSPQIEIMTPVLYGHTLEEIRAFVHAERVPNYRDDRWGKSFRQGGPLEWYNPPFEQDASVIRLELVPQLVESGVASVYAAGGAP